MRKACGHSRRKSWTGPFYGGSIWRSDGVLKTPEAATDVVLNILKQAGAEGTEEGLTTIANTLADGLIMGNRSELQTAKRAYMAEGYSAERAERLALKEWGQGLVLDVAGGAFSGGMFGSVKSGIDYKNYKAVEAAMPKLQQTETQQEQVAPVQQTAQDTPEQRVADVVSQIAGQNKNAPANETETESTAVNTNPATHTPQEQAIIEEYQNSVDEGLVQFAEQIKAGAVDANQVRYTLKPVSNRAVSDIKRITGVDASGFSTVIEGRMIDHTLRRHGENGKADQSMRDINDIARMQYVIDNYDSISDGGTTKAYTTNKPNGKSGLAKTVVFEKAVNGTYYVVEAVPDTKAKTTYVVSAYMSKNGTQKNGAKQLTDATSAPVFTAETGFAQAPNPNIANNPENVNRVNMGDTGANPAMGAADSGFDPYSHASIEHGAIELGENPARVVDVPKSMDGESKEETQLRGEMLRQMSELQMEYRKVLEDLEQELAFLRGFNMED